MRAEPYSGRVAEHPLRCGGVHGRSAAPSPPASSCSPTSPRRATPRCTPTSPQESPRTRSSPASSSARHRRNVSRSCCSPRCTGCCSPTRQHRSLASTPICRFRPRYREPAGRRRSTPSGRSASSGPASSPNCCRHATRRPTRSGAAPCSVPSLATVGREVGDIVHVDVGASAGLNLLIPHYDFVYDPGGALASGSAVTITCATRGDVPVPGRGPVDRRRHRHRQRSARRR